LTSAGWIASPVLLPQLLRVKVMTAASSTSFSCLPNATIAVGVVYNNARIQLAERAWELASLRVLGFTRGEVSVLLLGELGLEIAAAIPLGFAAGYGLAALLLALLEQGTVLGLRAHYLRVHGIAANGLLQAGLALAQQVSSVFVAYLVSYAFGRISGSVDAARVRDYTRRHWVPLVALAGVAFAFAMLCAAPLLDLFYSSRFTAARPLMVWALLGEFCRVMTQLWSLGALPLGALRLWIVIGVSGPAATVVAYLLLAPVAGTLVVPYATATGALVQLGVAGVLMARRGVTPKPGGAALLAGSLVALALLAQALAR